MTMLSDFEISIRNIFPVTLSKTDDYKENDVDFLKNYCYIDLIRKTDSEFVECLKFVNCHCFRINQKIDGFFINQVKKIKKEKKIKYAIIYNLDIKELLELKIIERNFGYLFQFYCNNISQFLISNKYRRKANKANKYFTIEKNPTKKMIIDGLKLYYYMDFAIKTLKINDFDIIADFYKKNDKTVKIVCLYNNEVVGAMFGFLFEKTMYMHVFFYNPFFLKFYLSDFLYQVFIETSQCLGAENICWGEVASDDYGLYFFKKHYSNLIEKKFFFII